MTDFTVSMAGIPFGVSALHPQTLSFCRDYLTTEPPAFTLTISQDDLDRERERSTEPEAARWSDRYLETLVLLRKLSDALISYDALLFHGSAVAVDGKAYIFTAPSGTGKTTHTRLWLARVPGAHVLNGDKPFLRVDGDRVLVCGNPWRGKERYGVNEILPLAAICLLERAEENRIEAIGPDAALGTLIRQSYRPDDTALFLRALQLVGAIGQSARLYRLGCNMESEAADVSAAAMIENFRRLP